MKKPLWAILAFTCIYAVASAQAYKPVLLLKDKNPDHLSEYYTYWLQSFDQPENVTIADSMYRAGKFVHWKWHKSLSLGDARMRLWVRIVVRNISDSNTFVWSIHDFLDTASLYVSDASGFNKLSSATYWDISSNRAFPARPLCFPFSLSKGQQKVLYLCIDQHNNNLYFPLHIRTAVEFLQEEQRFIIDQYWFWLIGFYLFSIVFSLILFSFLRDKIYLWYGLYVIFNTIFLLMEDSLDDFIFPQWLYSFLWHTGQYTFLLLSTATGIRIMQTFINQRAIQPKAYKAGSVLLGISFLFGLAIIIIENGLPPLTGSTLINTIKTSRDVLIFSNLFFILGSLIAGFVQKNRLAWYYGITYFFFFFSAFMFMRNHLGWASINMLNPNILAWGLFFELLTLTILFTARFRFMAQQSIRIKLRSAELEQQQAQKLIETQESERKRIAEDLHDDVGATLSALQLHISHLPDNLAEEAPKLVPYFEKAIYLANKATTDIRIISHDLLPKDFTHLGLFRILQNRIDELNQAQSVHFILITTGNEEKLSHIYMLTLYRIINELIQNVIKHAQASEATVQLLINNDEVQIILEDNGIGIENAVDRKGIGLKNIQSRVNFLQGQLNIDSSPAGTCIIIDCKIANDGTRNT